MENNTSPLVEFIFKCDRAKLSPGRRCQVSSASAHFHWNLFSGFFKNLLKSPGQTEMLNYGQNLFWKK